MSRILAATALLALAASVSVRARTESAALVVSDGLTFSGSVGGHPASFAVLPDAPSVPVLGPDIVRRTGPTGGMLGAQGRVGPIRITGSTGVQTFSLSGMSFRRRAVWFDRPFGTDAASGADVVLGPGSFPADPIRWRLPGRPDAGARVFEMPLISLRGDGFAAMLSVAGQDIPVQFSLTRDETLATAQAAAILASAYGGRFSGGASSASIRLGVSRPVRRLTLERAVEVGPIGIGELLVRTTDYGSTESIRGEEDPSEVVVVGRRRNGPEPLSRMVVGRRALARCSELIMDGRRNKVVLTCGT